MLSEFFSENPVVVFKLRYRRPIKTSKAMAIEMIVRGIEGATVVDFHGRLDTYSRWHVKAIMSQCCNTEQEHLILNLQGLTFIDSTSLGYLVLCSQKFKELNRKISWIQPKGPAGEFVQSLRLQDFIVICKTEKDALSSSF